MKMSIKKVLLPTSSYIITLVVLMVIIAGTAIPVLALHENDHRYTVSGSVFNDQGEPVSKTTVVIRTTTGDVLGTGKTSSNGSYKILLHLHNAALGSKLIVSANKMEKEIEVIFDPYDFKTERMEEVNFGKVREIGGGSNRVIIIGAVFLVVLAVGAYVVFSGKKKKKQSMAKGKKGKSKKKKR